MPGEIAAARRLREIARTWQPDVVHLHSSFAGVVTTTAGVTGEVHQRWCTYGAMRST